MSTSDWEGEDVESVEPTEGEEDVPPGAAEEVGGWSEGTGGIGSEADVGAAEGDLGGGGWTESGGATESGAEVGGGFGERPADAGATGTETGGGFVGGGAGDMGTEPADPSLGGGIDREDV